ncbi:MAG: hypothetical protein HC834_03950 [Rhodospirillales bacterium]|nr:hypothetical protein [Rhodospirillales bacterium]
MLEGDWLKLCTWNDFSEGTEGAPSLRGQWAIADLCAFYNAWFRSGSQPEIVRDCLYYAHRLHAFDAMPNTSYQTISKPDSIQPGNRFYNKTQSAYASENVISVLVFPTDDCEVDIVTAEGTTTHAVTGQTVQHVTAPLPVTAGGRPQFRMRRGGQTVIDMASAFRVRTSVPYWQDLKAGMGGSLRYQLGQAGVLRPPYAEPVELVRDWLKGECRYG